MSEPFVDLHRLQEHLARLPRPRDGYTRVFRGQVHDHGCMLPSSLRQGARPWNRLWDVSLAAVVDDSSSDSNGVASLENFSYWIKVLAQHYGPTSPFLDVTSSLEVALWFALHRVHVNRAVRFGLTQENVHLPIECPTLRFTAHSEGPGWLFVIDARDRIEGRLPGHGDLIDLARGPAFVRDALRVQRQSGLLLVGEEGAGDLSSFYACDPVPVAFPLTGARMLEHDPFYFFPAPDEDEWYARLLRAPLIPQPHAETGYAYGQSLGVYLVTRSDAPEDAAPYIERQTEHVRPLVRLALRGAPLDALVRGAGTYPEAATYISVEVPLLTTTPPVHQLWNESLLLTGLDAATQPEDLSTRELLPDVTLQNVLIEFSPLESALRATQQDGGATSGQWHAIWLVRTGASFRMTLFVTEGRPARTGHVSFSVEFDELHGIFQLVQDDGSRPRLTKHPVAKPFFVALMVLRELSTPVKPEPIVAALGETGLLAMRPRTARLVRALEDSDDIRLHFIRYEHSGERYDGPLPMDAPAPIALLQLDLSTPFEDLPGVDEVYGRVRQASLGAITMRFDAPRPGRHSTEAARTLKQLFAAPAREELL